MKAMSVVLCGFLALAAPVICAAGDDAGQKVEKGNEVADSSKVVENSAGVEESPKVAENSAAAGSPMAAYLPVAFEGYEASAVHDDGLGWPKQEPEEGATRSVEVVARTFVRQTADQEEIEITVTILNSAIFRPIFDAMFMAMDVDVDRPDKVVRTLEVKGRSARLVIKREEDRSIEKIVLVADVRHDLLVAVKATGPATAEDVIALAEQIDFAGLAAVTE